MNTQHWRYCTFCCLLSR